MAAELQVLLQLVEYWGASLDFYRTNRPAECQVAFRNPVALVVFGEGFAW